MTKLFDSHAHYYDRRFTSPKKGPDADELLHQILSEFGGPVSHVINVGTRAETSLLCLAQAARYEGMYVAAGLHPEDAALSDDPERELTLLEEILEASNSNPSARRNKKIVALGEIGLDYYDHGFPMKKEVQMEMFERQLNLAERLSLPVIIHDRDAHGDCFETILRHPNVHGVFHSYSGSAEMARELWRRGWMISFSGVVTFKNAPRVQEVAASVPLDHLLVETDAPYLTPHPYRGERNDSALMLYTVEKLAELHSVSIEEMARITSENAKRLFGID
jgi:TatD DNase family protein